MVMYIVFEVNKIEPKNEKKCIFFEFFFIFPVQQSIKRVHILNYYGLAMPYAERK